MLAAFLTAANEGFRMLMRDFRRMRARIWSQEYIREELRQAKETQRWQSPGYHPYGAANPSLLLIIQVLHNLIYRKPRNCGSIVHAGSCKISAISRMTSSSHPPTRDITRLISTDLRCQ